MNHRQTPDAPLPLLPAHPRQPNRPLLLASVVALGGWIIFLLLVALRVV